MLLPRNTEPATTRPPTARALDQARRRWLNPPEFVRKCFERGQLPITDDREDPAWARELAGLVHHVPGLRIGRFRRPVQSHTYAAEPFLRIEGFQLRPLVYDREL